MLLPNQTTNANLSNWPFFLVVWVAQGWRGSGEGAPPLWTRKWLSHESLWCGEKDLYSFSLDVMWRTEKDQKCAYLDGARAQTLLPLSIRTLQMCPGTCQSLHWKAKGHDQLPVKQTLVSINSRQVLEAHYRWWDGCKIAKSLFQRHSVFCPVLTDTQCSVRSEHESSPATFEGMGSWGAEAHVKQWDTSHCDSIGKNRPYLCSCFHPRERRSSECHYTPEMCWCTCCCGKRMHFLNRGLENKHRFLIWGRHYDQNNAAVLKWQRHTTFFWDKEQPFSCCL